MTRTIDDISLRGTEHELELAQNIVEWSGHTGWNVSIYYDRESKTWSGYCSEISGNVRGFETNKLNCRSVKTNGLRDPDEVVYQLFEVLKLLKPNQACGISS